ncbi:hypothetical protein [Aliivibrio fischeri]|uniref:hypothetical protein n=1 Tax=Aliivibrio fischeri TaxID=668 RepID=UPI0012D8C5C9|nr:hypothetical protein [Aliivibrio fischeri]MUJ20416.1 hypothetical protein [Aliivibrio fischeri]
MNRIKLKRINRTIRLISEKLSFMHLIRVVALCLTFVFAFNLLWFFIIALAVACAFHLLCRPYLDVFGNLKQIEDESKFIPYKKYLVNSGKYQVTGIELNALLNEDSEHLEITKARVKDLFIKQGYITIYDVVNLGLLEEQLFLRLDIEAQNIEYLNQIRNKI